MSKKKSAPKTKITPKVDTIRCNTVGEMLDALAALAHNPDLSAIMDATIDGPGGEVFGGFRIIVKTLTDGSEVIDFELFEHASSLECHADCAVGKHHKRCPYALALAESE